MHREVAAAFEATKDLVHRRPGAAGHACQIALGKPEVDDDTRDDFASSKRGEIEEHLRNPALKIEEDEVGCTLERRAHHAS